MTQKPRANTTSENITQYNVWCVSFTLKNDSLSGCSVNEPWSIVGLACFLPLPFAVELGFFRAVVFAADFLTVFLFEGITIVSLTLLLIIKPL